MTTPSNPELWLLRHGATAWARDGRHTSHTDLPLLPEGEEQARALAPRVATVPWAGVLVSPLQRARQTCELAGIGAAAACCDDLREWNYGAYEGLTTAEIRRSVPDWTIWSHSCPGGEDAAAVEVRCRRVIERALALAGDEGKVALVAHGHILRSLAGCWLGLGAAGGRLLVLGTAGISVLGQEREQRAVLRWNSPAVG
jgi:probable phosphoglycerate mutase